MRSGSFQYAAHAARRAQRDDADLAARHLRAVAVDQLELDALLRTADGVQEHLGRIVGARAGDRRRLGARVADHDRAAEPRPHLLGQLGRDRRGAGRAEPQRRQIGVGELREIDELRPLGRHAPAHRGVLGDHLLEHRLGRPRRGGEHAVDDELHLVPELVHVARVRERHRHQPHVVVRAEDVAQARRRLQRAVVEPRALRQTGRAAGPDDAHRILGSRGPVDQGTACPPATPPPPRRAA